MNETLIKLLRVYVVRDAESGTLNKRDRRIAMLPETEDFDEYLRRQYRTECSSSEVLCGLRKYEDSAKAYPNDSIAHFSLSVACLVWCEELEKDFLELGHLRLEAAPDHRINENEEMNGGLTTFRDFFGFRSMAINSLEKIVEIEPEIPAYIGACLLREISYHRQAKWWEWSIKPHAAVLHFDTGLSNEKDGRLDSAIREYREAELIDPDFGLAFYRLGNIYKEKGMFEEAASQYKELTRECFDFPLGHYELGNLYRDWGRLDEAASEYKKIIDRNPNHEDALLNLSIVSAKQGKSG
jgi:tetratricopeptide (TPR) repeat protein